MERPWRDEGAHEAPRGDSSGARVKSGAEAAAATARYPVRAPECEGDVPPSSKSGVARGRCRIRRRTERTNVDAELEQSVAQPRHQGAGAGGTYAAQAQFLHEHVDGGRQEDAQLVRPEPGAARAVDL